MAGNLSSGFCPSVVGGLRKGRCGCANNRKGGIEMDDNECIYCGNTDCHCDEIIEQEDLLRESSGEEEIIDVDWAVEHSVMDEEKTVIL